MPDSGEYQVIFTGKLAEGMALQDVLERLALVFKTEAKKLETIFGGEGALIKRGLDRETALRYVQAIKKAGAVCVAQHAQQPPAGEHGDAKSGGQAETGLKVIRIEPQRPELAYSPRTCSKLLVNEQGITLIGMGNSVIPYAEIRLLALYTDSGSIVESGWLVVFTGAQKRPQVVEVKNISFADLPELAAENSAGSLRNLLRHILARNDGILVDEQTSFFLAGERPQPVAKDIESFATALGKVLFAADSRPMIRPAAKRPATPLSRPVSVPLAGVPADRHMEKEVALEIFHSETETAAENFDFGRMYTIFGMMLVAGFLFPLYKNSILFGSGTIVWPWNLMGIGIDEVKAAAMGTVSIGKHPVIWAVIPLLAGICAFLSSALRPAAGAVLAHVAGAVSLFLLLSWFPAESEVLGIAFTPPTLEGGVMVFLVIILGALIAVSNHLRKSLAGSKFLRILSGVAGGLLTPAAILGLFAGNGPWGAWTVKLLSILLCLYGIMGLLAAKNREASDSFLFMTSQIARVALYWAPLACLIAQMTCQDGYYTYALGGGGGFFAYSTSLTKAFLFYYGSAFLMATGLVGIIRHRLQPG